MTRIRVDPALLRGASEDLRQAAGGLHQAGRDVLVSTEAAPEYEGQLGPQVRALGAEASAQARALADQLSELTDLLTKKAEAFEATDGLSQQGLGELLAGFNGWLEQVRRLWPFGAIFPEELVERYMRLGGLIIDDGGDEGGGDTGQPPWWAPVVIWLAEGWGRAVEGAGAIADGLWYGFPRHMEPPGNVTGQAWVNGLTEDQLLSLDQWQNDGTQTTPNDCSVTAMAIVANMALQLEGYTTGAPVQHGELARLLDQAPSQIFRFYRVPTVGAMPPGRTAAALNRLAEEMHRWGYERAWTAEVSGHNTVDDLIRNLQEGNPTIIFGVWPNGTPHAMVVAGYDAGNDRWMILNPAQNPATAPTPFYEMSTSELEEWWGRRTPWYQRYTAVVLTPE
jgi:uncharacterized protein YukE